MERSPLDLVGCRNNTMTYHSQVKIISGQRSFWHKAYMGPLCKSCNKICYTLYSNVFSGHFQNISNCFNTKVACPLVNVKCLQHSYGKQTTNQFNHCQTNYMSFSYFLFAGFWWDNIYIRSLVILQV